MGCRWNVHVKEKPSFHLPSGKEPDPMTRWHGIPTDRLDEVNHEEVEKLLAKIADKGIKTLTKAERDFLDRIVNSVMRGWGADQPLELRGRDAVSRNSRQS